MFQCIPGSDALKLYTMVKVTLTLGTGQYASNQGSQKRRQVTIDFDERSKVNKRNDQTHTLNNYNIAPTFEDRSKERSAEHPTETRILHKF